MEHQALGARKSILAPVQRITHDGMADGGQVHSNLVSAAGVGLHAQQCDLLRALKNSEFGDGRPASALSYSHALAMVQIAPDGSLNSTFVFLHVTVHQSQIGLVNFALFELTDEIVIRGIALGEDDHAACLFVQTVDDAGSLGSPYA